MNGLIPAGVQLGLSSLIRGPWRGIKTQRKEGEDGYFKDIQADVVVEEKHTDVIEITDHPVENSTSVTDHAYKLPREISLTLGWSDSPKTIGPWYAGVALAASSTLSSVGADQAAIAGRVAAGVSIASIASRDPSRVTQYYEKLLDLQDRRELVTIYTGRRVYRNMLLKSISMTNDKDSAFSATIDIIAREVVLVTTDTVTLKGDAAEIAKRGQQYLSPSRRGV